MNIGVLASHEGTTLQSVIDACASGEIRGRVVVVISNNSAAGALVRARQAGIRAAHLSSATHPTPEALDDAIQRSLVDAGTDLVFLAGYMKPIGPAVLAAFEGRILNTHPSLLPKFGGKGMYGDHVFRAVLDANETESGISVHLVAPEYDEGEVVRQCRVPIVPGDSLDTLKTRIRSREKTFVVETLALIADGRLMLEARSPNKPVQAGSR